MTLTEAAETLGVHQSMLSRWVIAGLVRPAGWIHKQGEPINVTNKHLREFALIRDLRGSGVSIGVIRDAIDLLRTISAQPFRRDQFIAVDWENEALRVVDTQEVMVLLDGGQMLMPLPKDQIA
jgi:DNA-binding transcriptional MerR regulator